MPRGSDRVHSRRVFLGEQRYLRRTRSSRFSEICNPAHPGLGYAVVPAPIPLGFEGFSGHLAETAARYRLQQIGPCIQAAARVALTRSIRSTVALDDRELGKLSDAMPTSR